MLAAYAKITVFALVSLAPLVALTLGETPPYGSPHPDFPEPDAYLQEKPEAFDALGEAMLHRSAITKYAVVARNALAYRVLHDVRTSKVVSGREDWLFYRPELGQRGCLDAGKASLAARRLSVLTDVAGAAGIRTVISLSPDKSAVYPEKLPRRSTTRFPCRLPNTNTLREALSAEAPELIDHAVPLLAEKAAHPERKLYFHTDTHWTPYGGALALRELMNRVFPSTGDLPRPRTLASAEQVPTDLRNGMLQLWDEEWISPLDAAHEEVFFQRLTSYPGATTIVHDSYYRTLRDALARIFPNLSMVHHDNTDELPPALADTQLLIINSVERFLTLRALSTSLSIDGALFSRVIERNRARAADCTFPDSDSAPYTVPVFDQNDVTPRTDGFASAGPDPYVAIAVEDADGTWSPCLRVTVTAKEESRLEIFLPIKHGRHTRFQTGRSFVVQVPAGEQTVRLVLPDEVRGRGVRLDFGDTSPSPVAVSNIAIGMLSSAAH